MFLLFLLRIIVKPNTYFMAAARVSFQAYLIERKHTIVQNAFIKDHPSFNFRQFAFFDNWVISLKQNWNPSMMWTWMSDNKKFLPRDFEDRLADAGFKRGLPVRPRNWRSVLMSSMSMGDWVCQKIGSKSSTVPFHSWSETLAPQMTSWGFLFDIYRQRKSRKSLSNHTRNIVAVRFSGRNCWSSSPTKSETPPS